VYLRARWYAPGQGRFVSEDPFAGWAELPYSLHAYQYAYSNPVVFTDPTGYFAHCALSLTTGPAAPAVGGLCVVATYAVAAAAGVSLGAVIACTGGIVCTSTSAPFPGPPVVPGPGPLPPDAQPRVLPDGPYLPQTFDPPALAPNPGPAPDPGPARTPTPMPSAPPVILPHGLDCPTPAPSMTPTPERKNRAAVQIQGRDITQNNFGAVPDTRNDGWMLSFSWSQTDAISAGAARRELARLWTSLTPQQQHRRDKAYYSAVTWIDESLTHSPPGRVSGEHFAFQNPPGRRGGVHDARVDVAVYEGVAFSIP